MGGPQAARAVLLLRKVSLALLFVVCCEMGSLRELCVGCGQMSPLFGLWGAEFGGRVNRFHTFRGPFKRKGQTRCSTGKSFFLTVSLTPLHSLHTQTQACYVYLRIVALIFLWPAAFLCFSSCRSRLGKRSSLAPCLRLMMMMIMQRHKFSHPFHCFYPSHTYDTTTARFFSYPASLPAHPPPLPQAQAAQDPHSAPPTSCPPPSRQPSSSSPHQNRRSSNHQNHV